MKKSEQHGLTPFKLTTFLTQAIVNQQDKIERNDTCFSDFRIDFYGLYALEIQKHGKKNFKSRLAHQKSSENCSKMSVFGTFSLSSLFALSPVLMEF